MSDVRSASRPRPDTLQWTGGAFGLALTVAVGVLAANGGEHGIRPALHVTARLGFLLFWPAYAGGALRALFGPAFEPLHRHARVLGLAFAAVLLVHLMLVAALCATGSAPSVKTFVIFGTGAVWVYALALFSIRRLQIRLGPTAWWLLRTAGMNYVAAAFALDFLHRPLAGGVGHALSYWPFAALAILGPCLYVASLVQRLERTWMGVPRRLNG